MITIRIDHIRRLFTVCAHGIAVVGFRTYAGAASLWRDLQIDPPSTPEELAQWAMK